MVYRTWWSALADRKNSRSDICKKNIIGKLTKKCQLNRFRILAAYFVPIFHFENNHLSR